MTPKEILKRGAEKLGIHLSSEEVKKFLIYLEELKNWNKKFNLTAIKKDNEIVTKHFLDSLSLLLVIEREFGSLVDIGPGAGFPSLPIKLHLPSLKCTLIESSIKKVNFLKYLVKKLNLQDVTLIKARAEEVGHGKERESFDFAVGRAVAKLNVLLEYTFPFLKVGGYLIAQKGKNSKELELARNALSVLRGRIAKIKYFELPFSGEFRSLIVIQKIAPTPLRYPRRPGIPQKRPL